jgi:hypothetical protein
MYVEKMKANHDCAWPAYKCYEDNTDIAEDQPENNRRIEKRLADFIKVLRPPILIAADEAIFEHELLAGLQYHQATPRATVESLCDDVLRTRVRTILLCDPPAALDADEVTRKTRCYVLTVRGEA